MQIITFAHEKSTLFVFFFISNDNILLETILFVKINGNLLMLGTYQNSISNFQLFIENSSKLLMLT